MNDEYLWQKIGEDAEIALLEEKLAAFRYRESDPPAIAIASEPSLITRWRFTFAFVATALAAVLITATVWIYAVRESKTTDEVTFVSAPEPAIPDSKPVEAQPPVIQPSAPEKQPVRRGREIQVQSASMRPTRKHRVQTAQPAATTAALTEEERYSYRQLMLALSITSSKLNIVKNTIDGVEGSDDAKQNNR